MLRASRATPHWNRWSRPLSARTSSRVFAFVSAPVDTLALLPSPSSLGSLYGNSIGDEGASALAAVLKETQITHLKCAAAPECSLSCQRPLTRLLSHRVPPPPLAHSLADNEIGDEGASALAAVLKETKITNLQCAAAP